MKVIFLDIDGVLNDRFTQQSCGNAVYLSPGKTRLLKEIVDATGASLVLSSSWRIGWICEEQRRTDCKEQICLFHSLRNKLQEYGIALSDHTPQLGHRGKEISHWLAAHPDVDSYIVLDDLDKDELYPHAARLVRTDDAEGLTKREVRLAIQFLNS